MPDYPKTPRSTVKRIPKRGHYDRATVHAVLDAGRVCHVGFVVEGQPFVIPTAYGREGDVIYLHGATTSRLLAHLQQGVPACVAVTHLDGVVLARSLFHHSLNYRSAVVFGTARLVEDAAERERALTVISEQLLPGRWAEARQPNAKENKATAVLAISIEEASAKIRAGGPVDDAEDYSLPIWAGVLPMQTCYGLPLPDEQMPLGIAAAASVIQALGSTPIALPLPGLKPIEPPLPDEYAPFYAAYVAKANGRDAAQLLAETLLATPLLLAQLPEAQWDYAYAPGKWSIREMLLHVIDTERIMAYRLLRISRGDESPLPGFDEQAYAANSSAAGRSAASLIAEYQAVRQATLHLLANLPPEAWRKTGTASQSKVSARALAYIIAGHEQHHLAVLRERYLVSVHLV